jgi:hypothetical protein
MASGWWLLAPRLPELASFGSFSQREEVVKVVREGCESPGVQSVSFEL